jgi:cobalt/nickel transport system permease protein
MEIAAQIRTAQECRLGYATLKTGFYSMGQLISNLFSRAYHQAERTYTAMESRGYTDEVRTLGMQYQTKKWHYVGAGLISALLTGLVIVFQCL